MSFSSQDMQSQSRDIHTVLMQIPGTHKCLETNKRIVIRCTNQIVAYTVAKSLRARRYYCEMAKGLKTSAIYVEVSFNSPY